MKKILFASTALIATAGMAAADVSFSGLARFGLLYDESADTQGGDKETRLESRFRLNIDGNAETDGGVAFSARVRMQADDTADGNTTVAQLNGPRFTTQYEGFRVDLGNIGGAVDNQAFRSGYEPGLTAFTGQQAARDFDADGYSSTGAGEQGVFASYAIGGALIMAGYSDDTSVDDAENWSIGVNYSADTWGVSLAYEEADDDETGNGSDVIILAGSVTFGDFGIQAVLGDESADDDPNDVFDTFYGISFNYDLGAATSIQASYGDGSGDGDTRSYAIGFSHDLGGGVSLLGSIGSVDAFDEDLGDTDDNMFADLGVSFNF